MPKRGRPQWHRPSGTRSSASSNCPEGNGKALLPRTQPRVAPQTQSTGSAVVPPSRRAIVCYVSAFRSQRRLARSSDWRSSQEAGQLAGRLGGRPDGNHQQRRSRQRQQPQQDEPQMPHGAPPLGRSCPPFAVALVRPTPPFVAGRPVCGDSPIARQTSANAVSASATAGT